MDFHGFSWIFMDFHGFSWLFMDFHRFSWIFVDFHGFSWILLDPRKSGQKSTFLDVWKPPHLKGGRQKLWKPSNYKAQMWTLLGPGLSGQIWENLWFSWDLGKSMKINENPWKSMKIHEKPWKYTKITKMESKATQIPQNVRKARSGKIKTEKTQIWKH